MKVIWVIAKNTYKEIIRDRILYGLIIFSLLLIGLSLVLGQLSFAEQARISANFGLASIQLGAIILAIFIGSTLVAKEIEKQTVLTLLVRPVSRLNFLLGKSLGLLLIIITIVMVLSVVLGTVFLNLGVPIRGTFIVSLWGILLEAMVLLGLAIFFSTFMRPVMVVSCCMSLFLIGHWIDNLTYFSGRSDSILFKVVSFTVVFAFPNLERFNWKSLVLYSQEVSFAEIAYSSAYGLSWWVFFLILSAVIIRNKDFV